MITGSISPSGTTVTLDTGITVPSWISVGAQVSGYKNGSSVMAGAGLPLDIPNYEPALAYQWAYPNNPVVCYNTAIYYPVLYAYIPPNTPPPGNGWAQATNYTPYGSSLLPTNRIPRIASIAADRKSFTLTTDVNGRQFIPVTNNGMTGVRFYLSQPWNEAMVNGVWQNSSEKPPTWQSVPLDAGFFGADGGNSITATPASGITQTLWFYADTWWAMSSGGTRRNNATFIHNSVGRQYWSNSANPRLSADVVTFQCGVLAFGSSGTTPYVVTSAIHNRPPRDYFWPIGGLWRDDGKLIVTGSFWENNYLPDYGPVGGGAIFITNPLDEPNLWDWQEIEGYTGQGMAFGGSSNLILEGDYYYTLGDGWGTRRGVIMIRYPKADIEATPPVMNRPEWWCGNTFGWVGINPYDPDFSIPDQCVPILAFDGYLTIPDSQASLHKNHNGDWLLTQGGLFEYPPGIRVRNLGQSLANLSITANDNTTFGDLVYSMPSDVAISHGNSIWLYCCKAHPEQTWSGQGTGEIVITYANNNFGGGGPTPDAANYWVQTLRVAGF